MGEVMTLEEAAEFLNFSRTYVYQMAREKKIPCTRKGKRYLFLRDSLLQWVKKDEQGMEPQA